MEWHWIPSVAAICSMYAVERPPKQPPRAHGQAGRSMDRPILQVKEGGGCDTDGPLEPGDAYATMSETAARLADSTSGRACDQLLETAALYRLRALSVRGVPALSQVR